MKIVRTVISVVFIIGTVAVIVYDAQSNKAQMRDVKQDSSKVDSASQGGVRK